MGTLSPLGKMSKRDRGVGEPRLVLIEWVDSHMDQGWNREEPMTMPLRCRSVGWLLHDGKEAKTIVPHMTDEEAPQRCGVMTIPSVAVVRIKDLR